MVGICCLIGSYAPNSRADAGQVRRYDRSHTYGDFDGDGVVDHAFGFPLVNDGRGSTVIVYGSGEIQEIHRGLSEILGPAYPNDHFGDSLSAGDIDGDGNDDLVVGVPGDDVTVGFVLHQDAGSLHAIYGSSLGLTGDADQIIDRYSDGLESSGAAHDRFGESIAVADFDCDGYEDVAVGVPLDNAQSGRVDDGAIHVIYGSSGGLTSVDDFFHQGVPNVSGAPENYDEFGASLAVGNFDGWLCNDLAVGVVGENNDGGYVVFFYSGWFGDFSFANQQGLTQNVSGVDSLEAHDAFGAQMWAYNDNNDGIDDLMVAVPGETCSDGRTAGYHAFRGHGSRIVTANTLNDPTTSLVCMDWPDTAVQDAITEYRRCMDFSEPGCGEALTASFQALDRDMDVEHITACEAGLEFALDACEHWITDPVCDVDLCIAAAHELSSISQGCEQEGDVLTDGY